MNLKKLVFIVGLGSFAITTHAQRSGWEGSYNRLGLKGGVNHFNILTDDVDITPKVSWVAGFTTRSSFYNDIQFIYGITFYDLRLEMSGRERIENSTASEAIPYNMIGVQGNFFGSYKILGHHLSVEAGPVVQVNGKLDPRQDRELYYVGNYDIQAIDLEDVSPLNINAAAGVSGGFEKLKFWVVYQYGINNIFGGLKDGELRATDPDVPNFKGNISMLSGGIVVFL